MADVEALWYHAHTLFTRNGGVHPPPSVVAAWPKPNHINPETRDWTAPIILMVFASLASVVFAARIWARCFVAKNAGLDDLLMAIAMLPLWGSNVSVILGIKVYGFQWHTWDQTPATQISTRQLALTMEVAYLLSTSLIKISILSFYRRLTKGAISKTFLYLVWVFIAIVIVYFFVFAFAFIFTCSPTEGYWHLFDIRWRFTHRLKCRDEGKEVVAATIISTVQDFLICALPILLVWNLQLPRRQKAGLIGIFGLGLVTCVCGILRAYYVVYVYYFTYDITWISFYGWIWTALEADLAVICASAPALKVFFQRYFNMSTNRSGHSYVYSDSERGKTSTANTNSHGNSGATANWDSGRWDNNVPLDRIKVTRGMDVTVHDGRKSDASTRNLTALPLISTSAAFDDEWV